MLLIEGYCGSGAPPTERLVLAFDARCKSRLRTRLESGEEAGLFLEPGTVLRGGDKLQGSDGRVVEVVAAPERLMQARVASPRQLARLAYHLGNRHVPVQLGEGWLRFSADPVLGKMATGLGAQLGEVIGPFEPETGAYAHGHEHGSDGRGARIHQYGRTP